VKEEEKVVEVEGAKAEEVEEANEVGSCLGVLVVLGLKSEADDLLEKD
jgi:hypothetical protein